MIKEDKFAYSPLRKALEKQRKMIVDQGKKQIKALKIIENNSLNLMNLLKRTLISTKISYHYKNKKKIFNELVQERASEFKILEKNINPVNLIYKYKNEEILSKYHRVA